MRAVNTIGMTFAIVLFAACAPAKPPPPSPPGGTPSAATTQEQDWQEIQKVEQQAKAVVRTDNCSNEGQCRTAAVGSRACGGPRYYLTFCAASTDTVRLFRLLSQISGMETAYNTKWQLASTCEFRMAPGVRLSGGVCQEVATR